MVVDIDEKSLKHGVLGLVIALVEIIKDALNLQAMKRMEGGSLTEEEVERLGEALMELDLAIEELKEEQGIMESVKSVRDGLDEMVDDVLDRIINPGRWPESEDQELGTAIYQ
ncbi:MAG: gas vesicle protein K [Chloroflexi bacterium]|nr:gas vesicle protein K [Chloroflexota bacterium]